MIQSVLFFLAGMAILAVFGRLFRTSGPTPRDRAVDTAQRCRRCRSFVVGDPPKPCKDAACPYR